MRSHHLLALSFALGTGALACSSASDDAGATTSTADLSATDDAPVTMTVTSDRTILGGSIGPAAGVAVVYQDASGEVIAVETTDANGKAAHVVPAGSQVTAVMGTAAVSHLYTVTAVKPGDALTAIAMAEPPQNPPTEMLRVSLPPGPLPAGTIQIGETEGGPIDLTNADPVVSTGTDTAHGVTTTFPVLFEARSKTTELAYTFFKGNVFHPGSFADPTAIALTEPWATTTIKQSIEVTHAPEYTTAVFHEIASDVPTTSYQSFHQVADSEYQTFHVHGAFADAVQAEASVGSQTGVQASAQHFATPSASGTTTFDASALLPAITTFTRTVSPSSPSAITYQWSPAASLASCDGIVMMEEWFSAKGASAPSNWTLVVPPSSASVQLPKLPDAFASYAPGATAFAGESNVPALVMALDVSFVDGYDAFRGQAPSFPLDRTLDDDVTNGVTPILAQEGRIDLTAYVGDPRTGQ